MDIHSFASGSIDELMEQVRMPLRYISIEGHMCLISV